jgi:hypothetical protein
MQSEIGRLAMQRVILLFKSDQLGMQMKLIPQGIGREKDMELCYEGTLVMPKNFVSVSSDEMEYVDGGSLTVAAVVGIVAGCIGIAIGLNNLGRIAGERAYYAGLRNARYQQIKWAVRAGILGVFGIIGGALVATGFENAFYSKSA